MLCVCVCSPSPCSTLSTPVPHSLRVLALSFGPGRIPGSNRLALKVYIYFLDCSICPGWWLEPPCTRQKPLLLVGSGDTPVTALQPGQLLGYGSCGTPATIPRVSRPLHTPLPVTPHSQPAPVQVVLRSAALCGHLNSFTSSLILYFTTVSPFNSTLSTSLLTPSLN